MKQPLGIKYVTYFKYFKQKLRRRYSFRRPRVDVYDFCRSYDIKIEDDPVNVANTL